MWCNMNDLHPHITLTGIKYQVLLEILRHFIPTGLFCSEKSIGN